MKLTFVTSNRTKLIHARHLAQGYDIEIAGKRYYGVAYNEPRLKDRSAILTQSYEDALRRWMKTSGRRDGFFFIEDTSVILDSLSTTEEYPGPDVKYWMMGISFEQLDKLLKAHGNDRRATVRSDVVLHLPRAFREDFSIGEDRVIFSGKTVGQVTPKEIRIQTNLIYPWLDNLSFNRWFVPLGSDKPLSALPIDKADRFDFRAGSIGSMLDYLSQFGVIRRHAGEVRWPVTPFLPHLLPPLLVVTGLPCAGKTTLGEHLSQYCGYYHLEASDFMKLAFFQRHGPRSRLSIHEFAERALREKPDIVVQPVLEELGHRRAEKVVITGFRSPEELEIFQKRYRGPAEIVSWYVQATENLRYKRNVTRARHDAAETRTEFRARDQMQLQMGLKQLRDGVAELIHNESTIRRFLTASRNRLGLDIAPSEPIRLDELRERPASLEEAIITGLAHLEKTSANPLTTTEIAHELNKMFGESDLQTSKNNVSRYFNFQFHPFYKVISVRGILRYKLSATGRSRAARLMQVLVNSNERSGRLKKSGRTSHSAHWRGRRTRWQEAPEQLTLL